MAADDARTNIGPRLSPTRFNDVRWVAETGSTNDDLLRAARGGIAEGRVLVADYQHAGRGRRGRTWEAPAQSSLLLSVLLRPPLRLDEGHVAVMAVALAAATACGEVAHVEVALKWPNDLVAGPDDRKVAGVLAESVTDAGVVDAVVVGVGINVNWRDRAPPAGTHEGVALDQLTGEPVDRPDLLVALLTELEVRCRQLDDREGRERLRDAYRHRSATIGRRVRVERATDVIEGKALDVTADGLLVVDHAAGPIEVAVGDVRHLRPA